MNNSTPLVTKRKILTLCLIHDHPRILLGMKKHGFGAGRWNGFGGKVEKGETIEAAAKREVLEEAGVTVLSLEKRGIIEFEFIGDPVVLEGHVFYGNSFEGNPKETDEMRPQWFHVNEIPYDVMWPDDRHWLPVFLAGKKFYAKFTFEGGEKEARIIESKITIVENFV